MMELQEKPDKQLPYRLHYEPVHYNPQSDQHLSFLTYRTSFFYSFLRFLPVFLLLFSILFTSCSHAVVNPEEKPMLAVEPDEATCTQIWVRLKVSGPTDGYSFKLYRNGSQLGYFKKLPADTVLLDEPLLPNFAAEYELTAVKEGSEPVSSGKRILKTLDTTSHNFTVQKFEFGNYSHSVFNDITIIDENNIWVAGAVYQSDSLGNEDYQPYNLFHWNGSSWEWKKLKHSAFCNANPAEGVIDGTALWGGVNSKILFFARNRLSFYQNNLQSNKTCLETSIYSVWGNSRNEFFGVGYLGGIVKYNGLTWLPIQSGTNTTLRDIWGDTASGQLWACGYDDIGGKVALLRNTDGIWRPIYDGSLYAYNNGIQITRFVGVWNISKYFCYTANYNYLLKQPAQNELSLTKVSPLASDIIFAMRGSDHNNIFVAGQNGLVGHYNGITYREIPATRDQDANLYKIAVKGRIAVAVGEIAGSFHSKALIYIIKQ